MRKAFEFSAKMAARRVVIAVVLFICLRHSQTFSGVFPTDNETDVAIDGPGFFILKDSEGRMFYRRAGNFVIDADGFFCAPIGFRLQGLSGDMVTFGGIRIEEQPDATHYVIGFKIEKNGIIRITLNDGTQSLAGQILLQNLVSPESGAKFPEGMILQSSSVGAINPSSAPGSNGLGTLLSASIEIPEPRLKVEGAVGQLSGFNRPLYTPEWVDTDLAIRGRGFFIVRDPNTGELFATRAGAFYWNPDGYLVNYAGNRVQGLTDGVDTPGDIRINPNYYEAAIDWWGRITLYFGNGIKSTAGRVLLKDFDHPELLVKARYGCFTLTNSSGQWTDYTVPGENGFGQIFANAIDVSQVDDEILARRQRMNFFIQGQLQQTGNALDCYIAGWRGMFIVRDPQSNRMFATRYGAFHLDSAGRMANAQGFRLQGMDSVSGPGDLAIDGNGQVVMRFEIDQQGHINVTLTNGTTLMRGQILLQDFADPHSLAREANYLYSNIENALPKFPNGGTTPESNWIGPIDSGFVEIIQLEPGIQIPPPNTTRISISEFNNGGWMETSSDFKNWRRLPFSFTADIGEISFLDPNSGSSAPVFYRIVVQTPQPGPPLVLDPPTIGSTKGLLPLRGLAAKLQQR
jgi:flagellar hook protein FlgE